VSIKILSEFKKCSHLTNKSTDVEAILKSQSHVATDGQSVSQLVSKSVRLDVELLLFLMTR
jgi:hypothetical protein